MDNSVGKKIVRFAVTCGLASGLALYASTAAAAVTNNTSQNGASGCAGIQFSAYAGGDFIDINTGSLILSQYETDTLKDNKYNSAYSGGVGIAYDYFFISQSSDKTAVLLRDVTIGLDLLHSQKQATGEVLQYDLSQFDNYRYDLDVEMTRLLVSSELTVDSNWHNLNFFIVGGIGTVWNQVSYKDTAEYNIPGGDINLSSGDKLNFAWDFGAGIKIPMSTHTQFSVRYLYSDFGIVDTSKKGNIEMVEPLKVKLHTHSVLLGFSYLFW